MQVSRDLRSSTDRGGGGGTKMGWDFFSVT